MKLADSIMQATHDRGLSRPAIRRVTAALATLEREVGLDTVRAGPLATATKISLSDDPGVWIVFGEWDDGTLDLIREGGVFPTDTLTGWVPGQSLREYHQELDAIEKDAPAEEPARVTPLFRSRT